MPFKIKLAKFSGLTYLLFILIACSQASKHSENLSSVDTAKTIVSPNNAIDTTSMSNESIEDIIVDTIFRLPEVNERAKYINEQTKSKRHLKVWVASKPNFLTKNII